MSTGAATGVGAARGPASCAGGPASAGSPGAGPECAAGGPDSGAGARDAGSAPAGAATGEGASRFPFAPATGPEGAGTVAPTGGEGGAAAAGAGDGDPPTKRCTISDCGSLLETRAVSWIGRFSWSGPVGGRCPRRFRASVEDMLPRTRRPPWLACVAGWSSPAFGRPSSCPLKRNWISIATRRLPKARCKPNMG